MSNRLKMLILLLITLIFVGLFLAKGLTPDNYRYFLAPHTEGFGDHFIGCGYRASLITVSDCHTQSDFDTEHTGF